MIGRLKGTLLEKQPPFLLIDVNGVGYECQAPMNTIYQLPELESVVVLHTHLSVSENAHTLFAFYSLEERSLFRELIKVNGVGPKLALAILSAMNAMEFAQNVHHGEVNSLVKIPGVGKKTAERLIIEMKDRLKDWKMDSNESNETLVNNNVKSNQVEEAVSALVALGYKHQVASNAINKIGDGSMPSTESSSMSSSTLIRLALKNM